MTHKFETLFYAIFFTFWSVRLYYKLYEKKTRKYILSIGILIVLWMFVRITKSVVEIDFLKRLMWYLYYIPLIFIPTIYYICSLSLNKNLSKRRKIILYLISSVLFLLVITNDIHQMVFKFPNGVADFDNYKHNIGYYIISLWIFYLFGGGMFSLAIKRYKNKKDVKSFLPVLVLVIGVVYTILYVLNIKYIRDINMSVMNSVLICLGIELAFYLDLIPNNSKYIKKLENSSLDINVVSTSGKTVYTTKSFNMPLFILKDVEESKVKKQYINDNVIYDVKRNSDSYVVIKKDISNLLILKKEISKKRKQLLKQQESLKIEERVKRELYQINVRKEVVSKIEKSLYDKEKVIRQILSKKHLTKNDLEKIQRIMIYNKKKSQIIISELNDEIFNEIDVKNIINELIKSMSCLDISGFVIIKNKFNVDGSIMSLLYDIVYDVIENIPGKTMMIYISYNKNMFIKIVVDDKINVNIKHDSRVRYKKIDLDTDTELIFNIKGRDNIWR